MEGRVEGACGSLSSWILITPAHPDLDSLCTNAGQPAVTLLMAVGGEMGGWVVRD